MKVLIAGDFVPRHRTALQIDAGNFCCLEQVKPIIRSADYAIVNFESPVVIREAKPIEKTGPSLKCGEKAMECISQAGFQCVTLANNHFRDYGQIGVEDTINICDKYNIMHVGGGRTLAEAEQVLYERVDGRNLAIISCCEHEWSVATTAYGGSNPLDIISICHAIQVARQKADYVLVIVHGGTEGYNLPSPRMKSAYRFLVEQGADAVINHHQHCFSGYEVYQGKPIFYGLGNFCFDTASVNRDDLWVYGYMVELQFSESSSFKLFPYRQCDEKTPSVVMLDDSNSFQASIEQLNSIIEDDIKLSTCYNKMARIGRSIYRSILAPYSLIFFVKLQKKGLLPSFATPKRIKRLLAYIQCESHRDILLSGLKKDSLV